VGWSERRRELSVALAFAGLLLVLAIRAPAFFAPAHLRDLAVGAAPLLILASGMTIVILARQIDISIGSQFAVCGVVAGLLAKAGWPMPLAAAGAVAAGAAMGALNGVLVARVGLPSIVVTLATMVAWREALRWATGGVWVENLPPTFQWFGLGQGAGRAVVAAAAIGVFAALAWGSTSLAAGRAVFATGSDAEVARLLGQRPARVTFAVFALMGALTGLAATVSAVRFIDIQTNAGIGLELTTIAAVVVGGTSIAGGRGSLGGTALGVGLLSTLGPALTFLGTEAAWERALQGLIILAAVSADAVSVVAPARRLRRAHAG
jgi:rhamnose transport system permease protein